MNKIKTKLYSDPGHGWYSIKRKHIKELGLTPTSYSYQRGQTVYLEEDCDASQLFARCKELGIEVEVKQILLDKSAQLRTYDCYDGI